MTKSELASAVKNGIAVLLIPLSLIVVLLSQVVHKLGFRFDAESEVLVAVSSSIGVLLFVAAVAYLAAGLRTYFPLVDLPS